MIDMKMNLKLYYGRLLYVYFVFVLVACESPTTDSPLYLPNGFEATVFVDSIAETVRHMAVNKNGDLYAKFKRPSEMGMMAAVRDLNNDGIADSLVKFGNTISHKKVIILLLQEFTKDISITALNLQFTG